MFKTLVTAISELTHELRRGREQNNNQTILHRMEIQLITIMKKVDEFFAAQTAFNERQAKSIDELAASNLGIAGDVAGLNKKIQELIDATGDLTPAQQVIADALIAQGEALANRTEAAAAGAKALDEQTPPVVPTNPAPPA